MLVKMKIIRPSPHEPAPTLDVTHVNAVTVVFAPLSIYPYAFGNTRNRT